MRVLVLSALLAGLSSCAFLTTVAKPTSTAVAAATGAVLAGPAGAAVGGGAVHAAWGITDAEEREDEAISDKDDLTLAILESKLAGNNDALREYAAEKAAEKVGEVKEETTSLWFWIKLIAIVYVAKQILFGRWTKPVLAFIFRVKKRTLETDSL